MAYARNRINSGMSELHIQILSYLQEKSTKQDPFALAASAPITIQAIADGIDANYNTTSIAITHLKNNGLIENELSEGYSSQTKGSLRITPLGADRLAEELKKQPELTLNDLEKQILTIVAQKTNKSKPSAQDNPLGQEFGLKSAPPKAITIIQAVQRKNTKAGKSTITTAITKLVKAGLLTSDKPKDSVAVYDLTEKGIAALNKSNNQDNCNNNEDVPSGADVREKRL